MSLAAQQHRIQRHAEIVDNGVALEADGAGFGIDVDLTAMRAVRIGRVRWRERIDGLQPLWSRARKTCDFGKSDRTVVSGDADPSAGDLEIADVRLQRVRDELLQLSDE